MLPSWTPQARPGRRRSDEPGTFAEPAARRLRRPRLADRRRPEDEHAELAAHDELDAHLEDEELELFPLAMFAFDDEDWAVLAATPRFLDTTTTVVAP